MYVYVCMHVCMYEYVYVCILYVCMYVCMYYYFANSRYGSDFPKKSFLSSLVALNFKCKTSKQFVSFSSPVNYEMHVVYKWAYV